MKASNGHIVGRVCVSVVDDVNDAGETFSRTEIEMTNDDDSVTVVYLDPGDQFVVEED